MPKVKVIDRGWNDITKRMKEYSQGIASKTGVQGPKASEQAEEHSGQTNVQLGSKHEFGVGVPERSHWRRTFDEKVNKYTQELDKVAATVFDGKKVTGELLLLGEAYKTDVIELMHSGRLPKLSQVTIDAKKGDDTTLVDTGEYMGSFTVVIQRGETL